MAIIHRTSNIFEFISIKLLNPQNKIFNAIMKLKKEKEMLSTIALKQ